MYTKGAQIVQPKYEVLLLTLQPPSCSHSDWTLYYFPFLICRYDGSKNPNGPNEEPHSARGHAFHPYYIVKCMHVYKSGSVQDKLHLG